MTDTLPDSGIPTLTPTEQPRLPDRLTIDEPTPDAAQADANAKTNAITNPQHRTFAGQKLHPFDWRRQEAADALGLKFFKLHGEVAAEFEETERYDGIAGDASIVVWLCTLAPSQVAKYIRLPGQGTEARLKWAEQEVGGIGRARHGEMMEAYGEILGDFMNSLGEQVKTPGK